MIRRFERLLAVDLDGTMLGDPQALASLNTALVHLGDSLGLAYVTGRGLASVKALFAAGDLLLPDWIISDVGTAIGRALDWGEDPIYRRKLERGWRVGEVKAVAARFSTLAPQPDAHQGPFKCSYELAPEQAGRTLPRLRETLAATGLRTRVIYSSDRDLDILPAQGGKGAALGYLASYLSLPLSQVLACGDSGNDVDMLTLGCRAAVVANAPQALLQGLSSKVYRAQASFAGGVHEALHLANWLSNKH